VIQPVEIQHVPLRRQLLLGYDRGEVDRLLEEVTASYEEAWLERDGLRAERERMVAELDRCKERERLVGDVLLSAHRLAEKTVAEARGTADTIVHEAREQADALLRDAQREPERMREEIQRLREAEQSLHERIRVFIASAQTLLENGLGDAAVEETLAALRLPQSEPEPHEPEPHEPESAKPPVEPEDGLLSPGAPEGLG
jgi:cell division initiation protein